MIALSRRRASNMLDTIIGWAARLSRMAALGWCLGLYAVIVAGDWLTGRDVSFSGLYVLPICLAAWSMGTVRGLGIGLLCSVTTVAINGFGDGYSVAATQVSTVVAAWNLFMRVFAISVVVMLVAGFRRSYDRQSRRARTDDLTGALTKYALRDHLGRAIVASGRRRFSLVLVYSDLDGFKAVNDRHGHGAGDAVLVAFADAAGRAIRSRDVLARVGGDEFVMLLTVASVDEGFAAAERLHREVGVTLAALPYPVTASMGAVIVERPHAGDQAAFTAMADSLMYEVKRAGKNALRIACVDRPPAVVAPLAEAA